MDGPSSSVALASCSGSPASRASRPRKGVRLRLRRRPAPTLASQGGDGGGNGGGGVRDDLALPLGMSFAAVLAQEEGCDLTANYLHPGMISTNITRYVVTNTLLIRVIPVFIRPFAQSIPQGAATTCYLALHPSVKDVSGKYFADCNEVTPSANGREHDATPADQAIRSAYRRGDVAPSATERRADGHPRRGRAA